MEYNFVQGLLTPEQALRARPTVEVPAQTPAPAQPTEVNPTQVVNQAVNHGIQQEQLQNATQQIAQEMNDNTNTIAKAANLLGVPEQGENYAKYANQRYFTKGLLGYKEDYARAEALGDAAGMQAATQGAMAMRNLAQENGIDITGFGADNDIYESRARYDYNNMQHLLDMDDDMDSGAYYSRLYNEYKDKGMSDKGADMYAAQKADEYQRNRIRRMKDEFYANGITNGAINPYGERLIDMIHDESPEALTAIATRLPGYMQEYIYQIGERQKDNAMDRSVRMADLNYLQRLGLLNAQQQGRMELAQFQAANRPQGAGSSGGKNGGSNSTGKKKGFDVAYNIMNVAKDIQEDPQWFIDHPEDHRLANSWNDLKKAFNDGLIDKNLFDALKAVLYRTGGVVWGDDNYKNYNEQQAAIEARKEAEKAEREALEKEFE